MRLGSRLAALLLFALLLVVAGWIANGNVRFLFGDFWFNAGLLMLILAVFVDQPFFSTESDVLLNGAAAAVSLIGVGRPDRGLVWYMMLAFSGYLVLSSYVLAYLRTRRTSEMPRAARLLSDANRKMGRPQVVFSVLFLWGTAMKFGIAGPKSGFLYFYWALFILFDFLGIARLFDRVLYPTDKLPQASLGRVRRVVEPNLVEVTLAGDCCLNLGTRVDMRLHGATIASGILIDDRAMAGLRVGRVVLDRQGAKWTNAITDSLAAIRAEGTAQRTGDRDSKMFVGVAESGSDVASVTTLVRPDCAIEEGSLLEVQYPADRSAYFQVVAGKIADISQEKEAAYRSVCVIAEQLGFWTAAASFESVPWVARANAPIYAVQEAAKPTGAVPCGRIEVGHIPHSGFPIHVGYDDLVTHNTAILGVTGSGKSFLAFYLVEGLLQNGVRVLILDPSRQHYNYLAKHNPTAITKLDGLKEWLKSDSKLGIYQFAGAQRSFPVEAADFIQAMFKTMTETITLKPGDACPARLCVVLEEAHSLIPEWNQVTDKDDSNHVNKSARVLLQCRKFGIGVMVITQRTANVVKTILNQCNTVFALQCFDETGLDFLKNYMGEHYARSLPVLPKFHAVLVGKASSSRRPVIFKVKDLSTLGVTETPKPGAPQPDANDATTPQA